PERTEGPIPGQSESVPPVPPGSLEQAESEPSRTTDFTLQSSTGPPSVPALPGDAPTPPTVFGRYQVRRALGAGGFGDVYLAHDTQLDRPVAIKVLHAESGTPQAEGEGSLQEARRLAQLRHPGIVTVHDVGVDEGRLFVVSEYLDCPALGRWLK